MVFRIATLPAILFSLPLAGAGAAYAHPHVFVEANLEIVRDTQGAVAQLRHVWRFDELFSSTVILDFDSDADGNLSVGELDEVSAVVTESIGENEFFTQVRVNGKRSEFRGPDRIMVDYVDGQILMFFALDFDEPVAFAGGGLRISVADPTYYVAMEIAGEEAIQITGQGSKCSAHIQRPDFDQLYADNRAALTEKFFTDPVNATLGDEWMTWIELNCG